MKCTHCHKHNALHHVVSSSGFICATCASHSPNTLKNNPEISEKKEVFVKEKVIFT